MLPFKRSARIKDLIKEEVANIIMHKLKDPRLGFITVTDAKVSNDLRHAKVFISVLEEAKKEASMKVLTASIKFIKSELSRKVKMKYLPELTFKLDKSLEYVAKIDRILNEVKPSENISADNDDSP